MTKYRALYFEKNRNVLVFRWAREWCARRDLLSYMKIAIFIRKHAHLYHNNVDDNLVFVVDVQTTENLSTRIPISMYTCTGIYI